MPPTSRSEQPGTQGPEGGEEGGRDAPGSGPAAQAGVGCHYSRVPMPLFVCPPSLCVCQCLSVSDWVCLVAAHWSRRGHRAGLGPVAQTGAPSQPGARAAAETPVQSEPPRQPGPGGVLRDRSVCLGASVRCVDAPARWESASRQSVCLCNAHLRIPPSEQCSFAHSIVQSMLICAF